MMKYEKYDVKKYEHLLPILSLENLKDIHKIVAPDVKYSGEFRKENIRVARKWCVDYREVEHMMEVWWKRYDKDHIFDLNQEFNYIHPFYDKNGLISRIVWLDKIKKERRIPEDYDWLSDFFSYTTERWMSGHYLR